MNFSSLKLLLVKYLVTEIETAKKKNKMLLNTSPSKMLFKIGLVDHSPRNSYAL